MNIASIIARTNDLGARNEMNVPERERDQAISKSQRGEDLTILEKLQKEKFDQNVKDVIRKGRENPKKRQNTSQEENKKSNTYSYEDRGKSVSYGEKGQKVEEVQKILKEKGYLDKDADGNFDYDTLISIKKYLEDMNATERYKNLDLNKIDDNLLKALKDPFQNEE
ncbi:MAG: hypothetical protein K9M94_13015 [Spirochaetia bacterium]|nr:hypothetical protein [Spirochaetia bacterium]